MVAAVAFWRMGGRFLVLSQSRVDWQPRPKSALRRTRLGRL